MAVTKITLIVECGSQREKITLAICRSPEEAVMLIENIRRLAHIAAYGPDSNLEFETAEALDRTAATLGVIAERAKITFGDN